MNYLHSTRHLLGGTYRDTLIDYDRGYTMTGDGETHQMRGGFLVQPQQFYLHVRSELFNTVSAAILFNQVALAVLLETEEIDAAEGTPGLGRLLLRTVTADCSRMITPGSSTHFAFECRTQPRGNRSRYTATMTLSDDAFILEGTGVLTHTDHHHLAAINGLAPRSLAVAGRP